MTCVCPGCAVIGVYVNNATDPIQGKAAALGQIGEGADVVTGIGGPAGVGAIQGAAQDDVWAIGAEQDQYVTAFERGQLEGAKKLLSSALKRGDEAVYDSIKSLVGGAFAGGTAVYGVGNTGITLAPFHDTEADVSDGVKAMLEQIETGLAQGTLKTGINPSPGQLIAEEAPEPGSCILTIRVHCNTACSMTAPYNASLMTGATKPAVRLPTLRTCAIMVWSLVGNFM